MQPQYHYVIVRADLPKGCIAANIVHAAGESAGANVHPDTHAVVLTVPSEGGLHRVAFDLLQGGVEHKAIVETDGGFANQLMAIGVRPGPRETVKELLSHLPLYR